jgi:type IV fimbrial biogenesis protein FimT
MNYSANLLKTCATGRLTRTRCPRVAGFTVIEMLTVVSIFGISAMIAVPSFSGLIASQRAGTIATDLHIALIASRSEATKRNVNVKLAQNAAGWQAGWQIQAPDPSDASNTLTLDDHSATSGASISGPGSVVYQSSGRVQGNSALCFAVTAGQGSSTAQRWVSIDLSGRPIVKSSSCS